MPRPPVLFAFALIACTESRGSQPPESAQATSPPASANGDLRIPAYPETPAELPQGQLTMRLELLPDRFRQPVHLTAPEGDDRLFVVEQRGVIRVVKNGRALPTSFLDIASRVRSGGEQGLLSLAFHPRYASNGFFFINFTDRSGDTRVERFHVSGNPDIADAASSKLILSVDQPASNHNGGHVLFGPDRMLYIGMGDGGGAAGDSRGHGQNPRTLLAALLRLDVDGGDPYKPADGNPFAGGSGGRAEIWAIGLRNPWRIAFGNGILYIADVGESRQEEVNAVPADRRRLNYGWNVMEGDACRSGGCNRDGLQMPVLTYSHSGGACSITGGMVYRGTRIPEIRGHYFYSDACAGWLRSFSYRNGAAADRRDWQTERLGSVVSFGEDGHGELYVVSHDGRVRRLAGVEGSDSD